MARDSFVFYRNMWEQLLEFKDKERLLLLVSAINDYEFYGREPELGDPILRAVWMGIKDNLDRDYSKYLMICKKKKERSKERKENDNSYENSNDNSYENSNENDFFKEKKEKFCEEVFSFQNYPRHHLQTFFDYYSAPQKKDPDSMLYESYNTWNIAVALAKWKAPPQSQAPAKTTLKLKTREERAAERKAADASERRRLLEVVEAVRRDPGSPRAFLVEQWQKNGTLRKYGIKL